MVLLRVHGLNSRVGGSIANADTVLNEPLVDGLRWVCHENTTLEVGLCKDVGEGGGMVDMETDALSAQVRECQ